MRRAAGITRPARTARAMRAARPGGTEYEIEAELLHEFRRHGAQVSRLLADRRRRRQRLRAALRENDAQAERRRAAPDRRGLRTRRLRVGHHAHLSGERQVQRPAARDLRTGARGAGCRHCGGKTRNRVGAPHDAAVRNVLAQGMIDFELAARAAWTEVVETGRLQAILHAPHRPLARAGRARRGRIQTRRRMALACRRAWCSRSSRVVTSGRAQGVPERFAGIGVRIEDDVAVTEAGAEVLTRDAPKRPADIESWMSTRDA